MVRFYAVRRTGGRRKESAEGILLHYDYDKLTACMADWAGINRWTGFNSPVSLN